MAVVLGQNLSQIRSNVVKKIKKLALSISLFHILHGEYLLKQKVVVVQTPEWKFKANMLHVKDVRAKFFSDFGQQWQKKLIIFENFILVSWS